MAYILGLWLAKGFAYGDKIFDITLHKKDKFILKRIAEKLNFEGSILDPVDRQVCRINFCSKVIYKDIINLKEKSFSTIPEEFLPDLIRGYFDGNGDVIRLKRRRINAIFFCYNKKILINLLKVLKEKAGIQKGSFDEKSNFLKFGKRDTILLGNYIYKNDPELFLLRKKQKFIL